MDLQTRKIEFVQAFLKLQSEELISQFENLLRIKSLQEIEDGRVLEPMSIEEFNKRIDQSESDFKNDKYKSTSELLKKFSQ